MHLSHSFAPHALVISTFSYHHHHHRRHLHSELDILMKSIQVIKEFRQFAGSMQLLLHFIHRQAEYR
jgi:hypothetical protein